MRAPLCLPLGPPRRFLPPCLLPRTVPRPDSHLACALHSLLRVISPSPFSTIWECSNGPDGRVRTLHPGPARLPQPVGALLLGQSVGLSLCLSSCLCPGCRSSSRHSRKGPDSRGTRGMSERASRTLPGFPSGGAAPLTFPAAPLYRPRLVGRSSASSFTPSSSRVEEILEFLCSGEERAQNRCGPSREAVGPVRQSPGGPLDVNIYFQTGDRKRLARGRNFRCRTGLETAGGPRCGTPKSPRGLQWGAPRARTRRGGAEAPQGCRRRGPGRTAPRTPCKGSPRPPRSGDSRPALRCRQSCFAPLGDAARGCRAPGRLCARPAGSRGCPRRVGVGVGCGAGLSAARRECESGDPTRSSDGGCLARPARPLRGRALAARRVPLPGPSAVGVPPAAVPAGAAPPALRAPPRPGLLHRRPGARTAGPRKAGNSDNENSGLGRAGSTPGGPPPAATRLLPFPEQPPPPSQCSLRAPSFHFCAPPAPRTAAPRKHTLRINTSGRTEYLLDRA